MIRKFSNKIAVLAAVACILLSPNANAEIEFSGYVGNDFPPEFCFDDQNGEIDVGIPNGYPITISGFDISMLCLQYDPDTDILYVGVGTQLDPETGEATIFGDADNDFDPGNASPATTAAVPGFVDFPDLQTAEYFAFIVDFDNDISTTPEFIAGVSFTKNINEFLVTQIAEPMLPLSLSFTDGFYGSAIEASIDSQIAFNPTGEEPSLEFSITNFSQIQGFEALDFNNPDYEIGIFFTTGSLADGGIGEDSFGNTNELNPVKLADITYEDTPDNDANNDETDDETNDDTNDDINDDDNTDDDTDDDLNDDLDDDTGGNANQNTNQGGDNTGGETTGDETSSDGVCTLITNATPTSSSVISVLLFLATPLFLRRLFSKQNPVN